MTAIIYRRMQVWLDRRRSQETSGRQDKPNMKTNRTLVAKLTAGLVAVAGAVIFFQSPPKEVQAADSRKSGLSFLQFTSSGEVKKPAASMFRKWVYVGTPVTPNDMNDGEASFPEFHAVYMDPISFAHFEKTGEYPDGTVLVKELSAVGAKEASSGKGYFMGDFTGLEITIKDSKRFKDQPGNWAYFSFGHKYPLKSESVANPVASCNACHEKNVTNGKNPSKDWVFEQYYPVLGAARASLKK